MLLSADVNPFPSHTKLEPLLIFENAKVNIRMMGNGFVENDDTEKKMTNRMFEDSKNDMKNFKTNWKLLNFQNLHKSTKFWTKS